MLGLGLAAAAVLLPAALLELRRSLHTLAPPPCLLDFAVLAPLESGSHDHLLRPDASYHPKLSARIEAWADCFH